MLLTSAKALANYDSKLVLLKPQPLPEKALESAGLYHALRVVHDIDRAYALLGVALLVA